MRLTVYGSLVALALGLFVLSCAPFQDSPFSDQILSTLRDRNPDAVDRIPKTENNGKLRIAVFADPHKNYDALDKVVYQINRTPNVDFVVNLGDVTDSGYNNEYDQFLHSFAEIRRPVVSAIGNHDAIGAGARIFRKVFRDVDFFFETDNKRFIFFDTANLEDPTLFKPQWLLDTVQSSTKPTYIFTHCSLKDPERFTGDVAALFEQVIQNPNVNMVMNGHNHVYGLDRDSGTILLQAPRVEQVTWLLLEIDTATKQMSIQNMHDGSTEWVTFKN